jgi:hypothetical protein
VRVDLNINPLTEGYTVAEQGAVGANDPWEKIPYFLRIPLVFQLSDGWHRRSLYSGRGGLFFDCYLGFNFLWYCGESFFGLYYGLRYFSFVS